jgi:hypothetical protein
LTAAEQVNANTSSYPAATDAGRDAIQAITGTVAGPGGDYTWVYTIPALASGATSPNLANNSMYYTNNTATCTNNNPAPLATSGKVVVAVAVENASGTNTGWCVSN